MKKVLVFALMLISAVGVFAQTPALVMGMYADVTATISSPVMSYAISTDVYLSYKAKDMGFLATLSGGADFFATPASYSLWYQWCKGLKLSAGKLSETGNASLSSYIDGNGFSTNMANSETGVMAYWNPGTFYTLAAFIPVTASEPLTDLGNSSAGISLSIPNVARFVSAYRLKGHEFSLGADIKAIKDITFKAGFKNSGTFGSATMLYATLGKTVGDWKYGVDSDIMVKPSAVFGIKGLAQYTIGKYALGGTASLDNGDSWYGHHGLNCAVYVLRNFDVGSIKAALTYDITTSKIKLPVDFVISF